EFKGKVVVNGIDTRNASVAELARHVGLVFQNPAHQIFSETVWQEVIFGPKNLGFSESEMIEMGRWALEVTGLLTYKDVPPWTLSGGEMKKLSIASVISTKPEYIAFDEPTIGQDAWFKDSFISLLNRLKVQGHGIILVTHDIDWLFDLKPDYTYLMKDGFIVASGKFDEIITDDELLKSIKIEPPLLLKLSKLLKKPRERRVLEPCEIAEELIKRAGGKF
ncbi:MAG TPA: ABC transporter ATP-binding protein, partial [Candidatus Korarchaeota archaeon]|nr:ABC transporter ATP-binding protein [Candidatus Korarchaeota archaeon]